HAFRKLIDHAALDFLPRRLTRRILKSTALEQSCTTARQFRFGDQDVRAALAKINADAVPGLEQREASICRCFGGCIENGWRAGRAGLSSVADAGQGSDSFFDQCSRWLHVHDFGRTRITDRPDSADDQQSVLVDLQRWIINAMMIVLRSLKYDRAAFEGVFVLWIGKIARTEFVRDDACLHDRGIKQVTFEDLETSLFF